MKQWYRQMVLIRRFEEEARAAYQQGKIGGFLHLYIGEEAIAVGAVNALAPAGSHRDALSRSRPCHHARA